MRYALKFGKMNKLKFYDIHHPKFEDIVLLKKAEEHNVRRPNV